MVDRIIVTIREHVVAEDAAVGADDAVRVYKPPHLRIVIAGLQVIPAGFRVVIVRTVTERVDRTNRRSRRAGEGHKVAPCIVGDSLPVLGGEQAASARPASIIGRCINSRYFHRFP